MGSKNKELKKKYREIYLESLGVKDYPIGIDLGPKANHFLSRVYYHEHHSKFGTMPLDYLKEIVKKSYSRNLFY